MRIQATNKAIYDLDIKGTSKEERYKCPACVDTHSAHKKNQKDLAWNTQENRGYCHRCGESFFEYNPHEEKQFYVPEWKNRTELTDKAVKYWEGRMISQKTLSRCKVYSDTEWMPQFNKEVEVMCFPYQRGEKLINVKYRGPKKSFKLIKGAELIFLNEDVLKTSNEVIIVEGEPDYLTWVENRFDNVISVPNGASGKDMSYFETVAELFEQIETVYVAVDNDTEGIRLRDELVRRIGAEKCKLINYKDCKDANSYFLKHGGEAFKNLTKEAKDVPIKGVVEVKDIYSDIKAHLNGEFNNGVGIGMSEIDEYVNWEPGRLAIVTGIPGHGKSEIIDYIVARLNLKHGWKAALYTPENFPLSYHYEKIYEKLIGKKFTKKEVNDIEFDQAYEYINDNFFYIMDDYDMSLDQIIEGAQYFVKKKGVKILVVDPYNRIEHDQKGGERDDMYVNRFLNKLDRFTKIHGLLTFLVAHPRTMRSTDGKTPTLYHINGGSNFFNKAEYGFTVEREKDENGMKNNNVNIWWQKIKFKSLGKDGKSELVYNYKNGRLEERTGDVNYWDNSNWLVGGGEIQENIGFDNEVEQEAPF